MSGGVVSVTSDGKWDAAVVLALTLVSGVATMTGNLLADIGYGMIDPRIRR